MSGFFGAFISGIESAEEGVFSSWTDSVSKKHRNMNVPVISGVEKLEQLHNDALKVAHEAEGAYTRDLADKTDAFINDISLRIASLG
ncbi:MAG TPA: hypothetical protein O0X25_04025 [Methanocorpusculum sp.]|nr:hypothetical protein [Methanocorpusculum sp.]HJJ57396.1 hypothetical protein [Methanocorpusculum sp.]